MLDMTSFFSGNDRVTIYRPEYVILTENISCIGCNEHSVGMKTPR